MELSEGKEFRDFRWLQPTPLITLVLSNSTSTLAVCVHLKLTVLICECLCAYSGVRYSVQVYFQSAEFILKNPLNIVCLTDIDVLLNMHRLQRKRYSLDKCFTVEKTTVYIVSLWLTEATNFSKSSVSSILFQPPIHHIVSDRNKIKYKYE